MQLSLHRSPSQFWLLTFLRILLSAAQLLLRLATTTTSTPPPLPNQPEPNEPLRLEEPYNDEINPHFRSSEFPGKPLGYLSRIVYEALVALVSRLPLALSSSPGEDQPDEVISLSSFGKCGGRTPSVLKDGTPTPQHPHAVLAWLVQFYLHYIPPPPYQDIVVPNAIVRYLVRASQWLRSATVLAYTNRMNLRFEGDRSFSVNNIASSLTKDARSLFELPGEALTQSQQPTAVPQIPGAGTLHETHFIPSNFSLLGCIEEPKGWPICRGSYSDVWRCNVRFFKPSEAFPTKVAVKVLRSVWMNNRNEADVNERQLRRFSQEITTWLSLPKHPNIVPLLGWTLTPHLSFISPWYREGNLYCHLKNLSDAQRIKVLLGIAKGLECLHSRNPPVAHGDLKPENILISDQGEPLLADFGLSTILGEERMYTSSHRVGGSFPWMSPEQMIEPSRSCQSDIYSFGSLAFTVMTGELPHAGLTDGQIALKVCNSSDPKDPVEDWDDYPQLRGPIEELLKDCWSRWPDTRPFMPAIVRRLMALLEPSQLQ